MNYRHAFHAGNAGDVLKHVVLVALVQALCRKPAPWAYLDTHAGAGDYDLEAIAARRTGEWHSGIGALMDGFTPPPGPLAVYLDLVRAAQAEAGRRVYPGSPALVAALARPQDRLALCETQDDVHAQLRARFAGDAQCAVHRRDGYEAVGALLPPPSRRGLTLLDPPYESPDEARALAGAVGTALRRFATGMLAVWYPLIEPAQAQALRRQVRAAAGSAPLLDITLRVRAATAGAGLPGSGMLVCNPPFDLAATLRPALTALAARLGGPGAAWTCDTVPVPAPPRRRPA